MEQVEGHITAPVLAVPIPGLAAFQNPTVQGSDGQQYLDIPFLAQYIAAVYTYALGIIVTIATVMVVIGGLKWMLARGDSGKVSDAKETLSRAVIGVLLALGSYAILSLLNPELVNLRAIRIQLITNSEVDQELLTTTEITGQTASEQQEEAAAAAELERESPSAFYTQQLQTMVRRALIPDAFARQLAQTVTETATESATTSGCPVEITASYDERSPRVNRRNEVQQRSARTVEFLEAITPRLHGSAREKIEQVARAASQCHVHMGSCLATVTTMNQAAGVSGLGRVAETDRGGRREITTSQNEFLNRKVDECLAVTDRRQRTRCRVLARKAVFNKLKHDITNYPNSWIDDLAVGDALYIYNMNGAAAGQHSLIFMGWSGNDAIVVQGGRSSDGAAVRGGTICFKGVRECHGDVYPVTKVFKPE